MRQVENRRKHNVMGTQTFAADIRGINPKVFVYHMVFIDAVTP